MLQSVWQREPHKITRVVSMKEIQMINEWMKHDWKLEEWFVGSLTTPFIWITSYSVHTHKQDSQSLWPVSGVRVSWGTLSVSCKQLQEEQPLEWLQQQWLFQDIMPWRWHEMGGCPQCPVAYALREDGMLQNQAKAEVTTLRKRWFKCEIELGFTSPKCWHLQSRESTLRRVDLTFVDPGIPLCCKVYMTLNIPVNVPQCLGYF